LAALAKGIIKGAQVVPLPWGDNVLSAGLHEFHYVRDEAEAELTKKPVGEFVELRRFTYFSKQGTATPTPIKQITTDGVTYYTVVPKITQTKNGYDIAGAPCEHENSALDEPSL
jgi:hypothetical protein